MKKINYIKVLCLGSVLSFSIFSFSYAITEKSTNATQSIKSNDNAEKKPSKSEENKKNKVEFTDSTTTIMVSRSKPYFNIIVKSNPTTGFSWALKNYDRDLITPVRHRFYQNDKKSLMVGASGYEKWIFRVKPSAFIVPQITSIHLIYMRPWNEQGAEVLNFKVVTNNADKAT